MTNSEKTSHSGAIPVQSPTKNKILKVFRIVLIVAVFVVIDIFLFQYFTEVQTHKGFVNGKLLSIKSPIEGKLTLEPLDVGTPVKENQVVGFVKNDRTHQLNLQQAALKVKIAAKENEVLQFQRVLASRGALMNTLARESETQRQLRVQHKSQQINRHDSDLDELKSIAELAEAQANRFRRLAEKGFTPSARAEEYESEAVQAKAQYSSKLAQRGQSETELAAANVGVQVEGAQTTNYSKIRSQELQLEISQQQADLIAARKEKLLLEEELAQIENQLALANHAELQVPVNGLVWSVDASDKEYLELNAPVIRVLNCDNTWVDTFVAEDQASKIDTAKPVQLTLVGHNEMEPFEGKVQSIRSGRGKFAVDEQDEILPPNPKAKSQSLVRIAFDWPSEKPPVEQSCGVGSTVKAVFAKR